jgi:hypothetical protein
MFCSIKPSLLLLNTKQSFERKNKNGVTWMKLSEIEDTLGESGSEWWVIEKANDLIVHCDRL